MRAKVKKEATLHAIKGQILHESMSWYVFVIYSTLIKAFSVDYSDFFLRSLKA